MTADSGRTARYVKAARSRHRCHTAVPKISLVKKSAVSRIATEPSESSHSEGRLRLNAVRSRVDWR